MSVIACRRRASYAASLLQSITLASLRTRYFFRVIFLSGSFVNSFRLRSRVSRWSWHMKLFYFWQSRTCRIFCGEHWTCWLIGHAIHHLTNSTLYTHSDRYLKDSCGELCHRHWRKPFFTLSLSDWVREYIGGDAAYIFSDWVSSHWDCVTCILASITLFKAPPYIGNHDVLFICLLVCRQHCIRQVAPLQRSLITWSRCYATTTLYRIKNMWLHFLQ